LLFLLDGLDEVSSAHDRQRVARWIEDARWAQPDNYFLVSCRFAGYTLDAQLDEHFLQLHLRPMSSAQVEQFVRNWYGIVERATMVDPEQAEVRAEQGAQALLETLRRPEMASARVYTMTHNPLLLTTICLVHRDRGELPRERALLYDEAVSVLLERWRRITKELDVTFPTREARRVLQPVAWWMHQQQERTRATAAELDAVVTEGLRSIDRSEVSAAEFLETIRDESGLLTGWGIDEFGFMHLGFQEFLAAKAIRDRAFDDDALLEQLARGFGDSWWQEVILLMLAQDTPPLFGRLMAHVVRQPEFVRWAGSEMMALCLNDAERVSPAPFVELVRGMSEHEPVWRRAWRWLSGSQDAELEARQVAALELLRQRMPEPLEGLRDVLAQHRSPAVRAWWQRWQGRPVR
ncbi:MAG: hypothetical protein KDK70_42720, partial [Myxococcales bacterium]|nr:hypothetical protein [Myxococcales bacterium]